VEGEPWPVSPVTPEVNIPTFIFNRSVRRGRRGSGLLVAPVTLRILHSLQGDIDNSPGLRYDKGKSHKACLWQKGTYSQWKRIPMT
jgi:hypothetical protein